MKMGLLRDWLGMTPAKAFISEDEKESLQTIIQKLNQIPIEQARYIASFAYILGRVAHADFEISAEETKSMEEIVREHGALSKDFSILVVQMTQSHNLLFGETENYLVTRKFKKISTLEQRKNLVRCLFSLSSSDHSISVMEENEIRQVSKELGISHTQYISIRSKFRNYLAVLKNTNSPNSSEKNI